MTSRAALVCAVVAVLGGATSPRGPAVKPADQTNPGPAVPDEKPANQDRRGDQQPVCTLIVVPADPRVDAAFARPADWGGDGWVVVAGQPDHGVPGGWSAAQGEAQRLLPFWRRHVSPP